MLIGTCVLKNDTYAPKQILSHYTIPVGSEQMAAKSTWAAVCSVAAPVGRLPGSTFAIFLAFQEGGSGPARRAGSPAERRAAPVRPNGPTNTSDKHVRQKCLLSPHEGPYPALLGSFFSQKHAFYQQIFSSEVSSEPPIFFVGRFRRTVSSDTSSDL